MTRKQISIPIGAAVAAAALGTGAGLAAAASGGSAAPAQNAATAAMGSLWATAPGPRVSPGEAATYANQIPAGARIDRASHTITFTIANVHLVVVASPAGAPGETFGIAGMTNPAISVPAGATVSIEVINADHDSAHGLVITASHGPFSWMPMMTERPAFTGSALWLLADPTTAGMHVGTLTFTAPTPGSYRYLCPVPGHAQTGMTGTFIVTSG